jgi:glycosyltransferase involved in cell wall biosynthesis
MSISQPCENVQEFINTLKIRKCNLSQSGTITPIVSIISSFFNAHQYFEETYYSLTQQTFQDFEWIIADDCSTDPQAIELFASLSSRQLKIKTIYREVNGGLAAGRNTAISHAAGKYLFFMDLDDLLEPTYLEKCVLFLETHPEFSFVNSYCVGFQAQEYWWSHGFNQSPQFLEQNWVTTMLMYRKDDFDKLGGFDENLRFYEDWERWLRAITNYQKGWTIPEYLHCYRRNNSGLLLSSVKNVEKQLEVIQSIKSRYEYFFAQKNIITSNIQRISPFDINIAKYEISVKNILDKQCVNKHILCFFPWLEVGGADKFNLDLVSLLSNRGYEITIATTIKSHHNWHNYFYKYTSDIFHLPSFLHDTHWLAFTRYIIESRQINIVLISNSYIAYYFLPILKLEFPEVTFLDYTHCDDPGWRNCGYPRISCQFSQFLDCQIVSSKRLLNFYTNINQQTEQKLRVCYTNEDTSKWICDREKGKVLRSNLGINDTQVVLLFPARIVAQKRPLFLVDIVKELVNQSLAVSVIILGQGSLLYEMQAKITQLGLDSVFHILPPSTPEQMIDFYSASDILLLPSEYEGISLAIYEAMSMGLPVVASDVGGQSELVTPETGFLVTKGDANEQEVKEYLQVLLPLITDSELRDKVGFLARQRITNFFSLEAMADQMEKIFAEASVLTKTTPQPEINLEMADELLRLGLEYIHQEEVGSYVWQEKCRIEQEKSAILSRKNAMETSKFWKIRNLWFKIKRQLRLTDEEP